MTDRAKHSSVVETLYTFAFILSCLSMAPLLLLMGFSVLALVFGWQVDANQVYDVMNNVIVLTLILLLITVGVWVATALVVYNPPKEKTGATTPSHDTDAVTPVDGTKP